LDVGQSYGFDEVQAALDNIIVEEAVIARKEAW
jgi:hypothetical protein